LIHFLTALAATSAAPTNRMAHSVGESVLLGAVVPTALLGVAPVTALLG